MTPVFNFGVFDGLELQRKNSATYLHPTLGPMDRITSLLLGHCQTRSPGMGCQVGKGGNDGSAPGRGKRPRYRPGAHVCLARYRQGRQP